MKRHGVLEVDGAHAVHLRCTPVCPLQLLSLHGVKRHGVLEVDGAHAVHLRCTPVCPLQLLSGQCVTRIGYVKLGCTVCPVCPLQLPARFLSNAKETLRVEVDGAHAVHLQCTKETPHRHAVAPSIYTSIPDTNMYNLPQVAVAA